MREAVVAVLRHRNRFLVIQRGPEATFPGYWAPLSGRIESGESQEEALKREVNEEVGLRITPLEKIWECHTDDNSFLLHWWSADAELSQLVLDRAEVSDARWVTSDEFLEMEPSFVGDRHFFQEVLPAL